MTPTSDKADTQQAIDAEALAIAIRTYEGYLADMTGIYSPCEPDRRKSIITRFSRAIQAAKEDGKSEPKSLRAYLTEKKIRQREFASFIGTSPVVVNRFIMGDRKPGPKMVSRIEAATGGEVNFHSWFPPLPAIVDGDAP